MLYQLSYFRKFLRNLRVSGLHLGTPPARRTASAQSFRRLVGGGGLEPPNPEGADLQSAAIATMRTSQTSFSICQSSFEPIEGFEPTTPRLQITCSGQLSYIGAHESFIAERTAKVDTFFEFTKFFRHFSSSLPKVRKGILHPGHNRPAAPFACPGR